MAKGDDRVDYELLRQLVRDSIEREGRSPRAISMAASGDANPDLVRNLLTGTNPKFGSVLALCEQLNLPINRVLHGVTIARPEEKRWMTVKGEVKAGAFQEQPEWGPDEWYEVQVEPIPGFDDHGLEVVGDSMNLIFPKGTILRCVDVIGSGLSFQDEDYVIVERNMGDLSEVTCKKLSLRDDGSWELCAESTNPKWKEPIYIGRPLKDGAWGFDAMDEAHVRVKAIVIDAMLPLRRRKIRRPVH